MTLNYFKASFNKDESIEMENTSLENICALFLLMQAGNKNNFKINNIIENEELCLITQEIEDKLNSIFNSFLETAIEETKNIPIID